jgi:hypothetical protein
MLTMTLTNTADSVDKKKAPTRTSFKPGSIPATAVLTPQNALDIRNRYAVGAEIAELAKIYGVSYQHVWDIVNHRVWRNALQQVRSRAV